MEPNSRQGRRELVATLAAAVLIQVSIGAMASLRGDTIAWGSLVHRPLLLGGLWIAAMVTKRLGYVLLTAWFAHLALTYFYGGFVASYTALMIMRWIAAVFFAWSAVRLATSVHIRAYRHRRSNRS